MVTPGDIPQMMVKKLKVTGIVRESSDTKSFMLQPVDGNIVYRAGQFLTLVAYSFTGRTIRRSYSISSSPDIGEPLTITAKRIANGEFSRMLFDRIQVGDVLETIGASGFFVLPEEMDASHVVFFAAGSGITPVFSILKSLLHKHQHVQAVMIYSSRNDADTIFHQSLLELQQKFSERLFIKFLFSNSVDLSVSRLTPITLESILQSYNIPLREAMYYICGPADYMRMVHYTLTTLGAAPGKIKREIFYVQQPAVVPAPADTRPHEVSLTRNGKTYTFTVRYPVTILQAAKMINIDIPFSCETGQCGTCVAKCLHGKVWMNRNEVLLDEDILSGYVLTCTGYPVDGNVILTM